MGEGSALLLFWVIGPHQARRFLFISQTVGSCPFATCVAALRGLSHSQLRFIRDLVSHSMHRAYLREAARRRRPAPSPHLPRNGDQPTSGCVVHRRRGMNSICETPDSQVLMGLLPFM